MSKQRNRKAPTAGNLPPEVLQQRLIVLGLCVAMLIFALLRLRLAPAPLERDEGEYAYAGQLILKGIVPFVEVYNMKMPGIYAAYAAILAAFGQTAFAIHLGLLVINAASIALLFVLVRRYFDATHAIIAAVTYGCMTLSSGALGAFAHATHFVNVFGLAALSLTLRPAHRIQWWEALASGVLWGCAFMMKQHAAPFILVAGAHLVWTLYRDATQRLPLRVLSAVLFAAGVLIPFGIVCLTIWRAGAFERFWFWTFEYARAYVGVNDAARIPANLGFALWSLVPVALLTWVLTLIGLVSAQSVKGPRAFLLSCVIAGCIAVSPGYYYRQHYFVLLFPVLSVMAAIGAHTVARFMPENFRRAAAAGAPVLVAAIAWGQYAIADRAYLLFQSPTAVSRAIYGENPFPESVEIARYLREHMTPEDKLAVMGSEPQIMFYAQRRSATGFVYIYPLFERQRLAKQMQAQFREEVEKGRPKYVVYVFVSTSWRRPQPDDFPFIDWAAKFIQNQYERVGVIDITPEMTAVYWDEKQVGRTPASPAWVGVFKRKDS